MTGNGFNMDNKTEIECKELIHKYYSYKQDGRRIKGRNKIYCIMSADMQMWVKSILKKWGRYEEKEEVLSISFDAFLFCLERYNISKENSLPKFFFDATRYFLLMKYGKKDKVRLPIEELQEILRLENNSINNIFDNLLTLTQFRNVIPDKYKVIWDDAVMSLDSDNRKRLFSDNINMDKNFYYKVKQILVPVIRLIMNIK